MKGGELGSTGRKGTDAMDAKVYQIPQRDRGFIHSLGDDGQASDHVGRALTLTFAGIWESL